MRFVNHVSELIGNTPLVKLSSVTQGIQATVLAKVEYMNPGGSVKDRIAERMVAKAEELGLLRPGGTIVEPTSGNTGVGLALVAQRRGYRCIFTVPDKVAEDRRNTLIAYGAEIVVCPSAVAHDDPRSYFSVSKRLAREIPGAYMPDQYSNEAGPDSHYSSTGPEIWEATDKRVTHVVIGIGTGGTITGVGRFLKEVSGQKVRIIGCDPFGSAYSQASPESRPYLVEGVGRGNDFLPGNFDASVVDEIIAISDAESFDITRRLAREEGLLIGPSCGMATAAALKVARRLPASAVVVVILPDGGRGYLDKVYNDTWMMAHGFQRGNAEPTVESEFPLDQLDFPFALESTTLSEARLLMEKSNLTALPVLAKEPPVQVGHVLGTVTSQSIDKADGGSIVKDFLGPKPGLVGVGQDLEAAEHLLHHHDVLLVLSEGDVMGLLGQRALTSKRLMARQT